jgi:hypothetical protein
MKRKTSPVFTRKLPSLRNFAVVDNIGRLKQGRVFQVQDRRGGTSQVLFIPNKLRAWPRYLEILREVAPTPVRLRNGNVGFLLGDNANVNELRTALQRHHSRIEFDALSGFSVKQRKRSVRKHLWGSLGVACSTVLIIVAILPNMNNEPPMQPSAKEVIKLEKSYCDDSTLVKPGFTLERQANSFKLGDEHYKLLSKSTFGGLATFKMVRECDKRELKITAWLVGKTYEISSVN